MPRTAAHRRPPPVAPTRNGATTHGLTALTNPANTEPPSSACAAEVPAPAARPTTTAPTIRSAMGRSVTRSLAVVIGGTVTTATPRGREERRGPPGGVSPGAPDCEIPDDFGV